MNKQPEPTAADMLNAVGRALYGNDWTAGLAAGLGVERETVRSWRRGHDARFGPGHGAMDDLLALGEEVGGDRPGSGRAEGLAPAEPRR